MLSSVSGYYNGTQIVMDEDLALQPGQRVIVTVLEDTEPTLEEKRKKLRSFMNHGRKMFEGDAQDYVRELRDNDRM